MNQGNAAFNGCASLTSVDVPSSVTSIGNAACEGYTGLTSVNIPSSVTSIGTSAFEGCTGLTSVNIPSSVTGIGNYAINGCTDMTSATIMNPDCAIGNSAYDVFKNCAFGFTLFGYSGSTAEAYASNTVNPCGFELLAPAPDFFLPAALTSIEADAFQGIAAEAVAIPKTIQSITGNPFADSSVLYIYGFPSTAAETLAQSYTQFDFIPLTDDLYAWLTK